MNRGKILRKLLSVNSLTEAEKPVTMRLRPSELRKLKGHAVKTQYKPTGAPAKFLGMANDDHGNIVAVVRINNAPMLKLVHPSQVGIEDWCPYCGCLEEPRDDLWEGQDWPRCPSCQGC